MQRNKSSRDWERNKFNHVKNRAMTTEKNFNRHPAYKIIVVCLGFPSSGTSVVLFFLWYFYCQLSCLMSALLLCLRAILVLLM